MLIRANIRTCELLQLLVVQYEVRQSTFDRLLCMWWTSLKQRAERGHEVDPETGDPVRGQVEMDSSNTEGRRLFENRRARNVDSVGGLDVSQV